MKKIYYTIILLVIVHVSNAQYANPEITESIAKSELHGAQKRSQRTSNPNTDSIDVHYHLLKWNVNPHNQFISGSVFTKFSVRGNNIVSVIFDKHNNLIIDSIAYHQNLISHATLTNQIQIFLPAQIPSGQLDSITVYYHGIPPNNGGFRVSSHAGVAEAWTISEPYGASDWWVCKDGLMDKIDSIDLEITVPLGNVAASHGVLTQIDTINQEVVYHWRHRHPIVTYLVSLAVTNYALIETSVQTGGHTMPIMTYSYPEDSTINSLFVGYTNDQIHLFDSLFISYPFGNEKYGHAQTKIGGGMEHQTISTMGYFNVDLIAHELAHQWFGNFITCGSWSDLWLNEGFATYLTGLNKEFNETSSSWTNWKQNTINTVTSFSDGSVYVADTLNFNRLFNSRLTYKKGALVLHMLRFKLGDDAFFQGVRSYLNDINLENKFALTADLKFHLEQSSGADLTEFFNDWVYGEGHPTFEITSAGLPPNYKINVAQYQSHNSVSFFETPLELKIIGATRDTLIRIDVNQNNDWYNFTFNEVITAIEVDPNYWLAMGGAQVILSTQEMNKPQIVAFPNPCHSTLQVKGINGGELINNSQVYTISGQLVTVPFHLNGLQGEWDVSNLPNGVYYLKPNSGGDAVKFVVSH